MEIDNISQTATKLFLLRWPEKSTTRGVLGEDSPLSSHQRVYKLLDHALNIHEQAKCCASVTSRKELAELKLTRVMPDQYSTWLL
jgi:hypothetical protein